MDWWKARSHDTSKKPGQTRPLLAVGAMNFGGRTPADESERIVRRARERGLVFFDTANAYNDGESERILGRALASARDRDACIIATKVGFGRVGGKSEGLSRARILAAIDESLARLGTDHVDLYYLHVPDASTPIEESMGAIAELLEKRKILHWGVSNYASWQILEMMLLSDVRGMPRPVLSQQMYNLLVRQLDIEYFKFTANYPIHTTVYNPLAGGLLTGKHTRGGATKGSRFENSRYKARYWTDAMFDRVDALAAIAEADGLSLTDFSYAWLAGRPSVDSILVGPGTVEHLDAAIDAVDMDVSPAAREKVDALYREWQGTDATYAR